MCSFCRLSKCYTLSQLSFPLPPRFYEHISTFQTKRCSLLRFIFFFPFFTNDSSLYDFLNQPFLSGNFSLAILFHFPGYIAVARLISNNRLSYFSRDDENVAQIWTTSVTLFTNFILSCDRQSSRNTLSHSSPIIPVGFRSTRRSGLFKLLKILLL